jgi:lipopolysaccharide transport system permease protein
MIKPMSVNNGYEVRPTSLMSREFLSEIWFFRRLIGLFIWRDIIVRYKNTLIGAAWYILQPVTMMLVFTLFFGGIFARYIGTLPYPVFVYGGLLLWQLFSRSLSLGAQSLIYFGPMLGKVYFPRIIAPASFVIGTLFDFCITAVLMVVLMAVYGLSPGWHVVFVPVVLVFTLMFSMGVGSVLAAVDARYRDIRHAVPLLIQVWMFCTPVMYPISYIPEKWRMLYAINPMVGLTEAFRWLIFGIGEGPSLVSLVLAGAVSVTMFVAGVLFFQKVQGTLVDTL